MGKTRLVLATIVLFSAGFGGGWLVARQFPGQQPSAGPAGPAKPVVYYAPGEPDLLAPAPAWDTLKYPNSDLFTGNFGGGRTAGDLELGATSRISLTTTDDFDKVWTFYKEKFHLAKPESGAFTQRFENVATEKAITVKVFDDIQAHALVGPKSDLMAASGFTVHSLRYQLVGFVYRPKGADRTCILLAYRPNTEFIALLKDRLTKE